jgi:hypothetical protein
VELWTKDAENGCGRENYGLQFVVRAGPTVIFSYWLLQANVQERVDN